MAPACLVGLSVVRRISQFRPGFCFEENVLLFKALMVVPKASLARCKTLRDHLNYFVLFEAINSSWRWFETEDKLTHCILCGQFIWIILLNWTNYELKQQTWRCKGKGSLFFSAWASWMCGADVLWPAWAQTSQAGPSLRRSCRCALAVGAVHFWIKLLIISSKSILIYALWAED